ncbi:MAG: RecX family transcriptional regulator [Anaerolineae bacterium]|nr:RecX family transcriptional regulator [Anaerolineae bacterium]
MGRTITALEVQKRNKERVNVYLDNEFAFGLPLIEAARLHKGQVLSGDDIAQLRTIDEVTRAVDHAATLLARRPYSAAEIRRNLKSKQIAPDIIDQALARLTQLGYVDDRAFVQFWIENRERFKPRGPRALRVELRQKGITSDLIDEALTEIDTHDSAYRAAQEKVSRLRGLTQDDFQIKLGAFLARRGFDYGTVRDIVDRLANELLEEQPDYFVLDQT